MDIKRNIFSHHFLSTNKELEASRNNLFFDFIFTKFSWQKISLCWRCSTYNLPDNENFIETDSKSVLKTKHSGSLAFLIIVDLMCNCGLHKRKKLKCASQELLSAKKRECGWLQICCISRNRSIWFPAAKV